MKRSADPPVFLVGEKVLLGRDTFYRPRGKGNKMKDLFEGPYLIVAKPYPDNDSVYRIKPASKDCLHKKEITTNKNNFRKYYQEGEVFEDVPKNIAETRERLRRRDALNIYSFDYKAGTVMLSWKRSRSQGRQLL